MNWERTEIDTGIVKEGGQVYATFKANNKLPMIRKIELGCASCTSYKFDPDDLTLKVRIQLGRIPKHLRDKGVQEFRKILSVIYVDGNVDVLNVTGKKIAK